MGAQLWGEDVARGYDEASADRFAPAVLDPTVEFLARRAGGAPALEFAIGTGRVGLALSARGVRVAGIEMSEAMSAELRRRPGSDDIRLTMGDMATATAPGRFGLVYLVYNTITNLLTQTEQVECFRNAARHLEPGGRFVIEVGVPDLQWLPPGETARLFGMNDHHVGVDSYDLVNQRLVSHHYRVVDGRGTVFRSPHRYVWPSELDLMATIAGMELRERWADWDESPFTADSRSHVSVWEKPDRGGPS